MSLMKLWVHESKRVFHDRLSFDEDISKFNEYLQKSILAVVDSQLMIGENDIKELMADTNIFTSFA